jgi:hypothetical protein
MAAPNAAVLTVIQALLFAVFWSKVSEETVTPLLIVVQPRTITVTRIFAAS